ncbi:GntR family transcriptional regulator [Bosea sp. (in: a-proteobacteria)]|uniref:GntR family transcriptional regulator n=1 Tax=Bosea sp. (in: a-proteobacteria) TaxID=1871050 RepID=UPI002FC925CE
MQTQGGERMQLVSGDANLREKVVHQLRIEIVSGEMPPGTVCSVPSLARELGISTTPIREALLELTSDGLLQPMRNRGFRVVDPSLDELRGIFEVRTQLETSAFRKLARLGASDLGELRTRADEIALAVETGDVPRYLAADRAFHAELLALAGNDVLADIVMRLRDRMRLYGIRSPMGLARQKSSVAEHYRIIEIVEKRLEAEAEMMVGHIMAWEPIFTEAIRDRGERQDVSNPVNGAGQRTRRG